MKSILTKKLNKIASTTMAEVFPESSLCKDKTIPPGIPLWVLNATGDIHYHIMLMISPKEDRFTFEIAWTRGNDYPVEQDNEITKHLVVELPPRGAERKRVFAWAGALALESGFDPDEDWGQTELYVMLD